MVGKTTRSKLGSWYETHGRHDLVWRQTSNKWIILISEVMLQQTPVARVEKVFDAFVQRFPTPSAMAESSLADVIRAWDRLGYPRRARNLYATSLIVAKDGWPTPEEYEMLPGVGTYTASALRALTCADETIEEDHFANDVNITRVCSRMLGTLSSSRNELFSQYKKVARGLGPRDGVLAVMDVGSLVCTKKDPSCSQCPVKRSCATKGPLANEPVSRQKPYEGSFRQRRGDLLRQLRDHPVAIADTDSEVLISLLDEGFVRTTSQRVFLADALHAN